MTAEPVDGKCNGLKDDGSLCGLPAGWGTDHPGFGRCKLHGGGLQKHGAYSIRTSDPQTQKLADELQAVLDGDPKALFRPIDRIALEGAARLIRQAAKLEEWLNKYGTVDNYGEPYPAVEVLAKIERAIGERLSALGMTPASRARMGVDLLRGKSLAEQVAEAHEDDDDE